ncbi:hypothetical protein SAMN05421747_116125 [Parapedobacter composti]|uniref:Uncharacterized protein n=1 Tax=Parapedobacter composti TaxID=623281 RepID=A0A1I1KPR7_9SPHI|nr:hypothetical protein [Parapedobacter composti]SFC62701.1 hypothetical protein SAMN05421747_116125 [Parapedobacter composti]
MKRINIFAFTAWLALAGCAKVEYREIHEPAYLRVFNNLNYEVKLENRFEEQPFLTMLIDPEFDAEGVPIGGAIVGDHLDQRASYAPPFPTHSSTSTSYRNPEYPGKANVLVGPVLNGFDLSSWAQIPSGEHRILFVFRPISAEPFAALPARLRSQVFIDTVVSLAPGEVYTLHVLQKDFVTKQNGMILRQENFHKQPFADSLVYFNVYNMSAKGFWNAESMLKPEITSYGNMRWGMRDEMDMYLTLNRSIPGVDHMTTLSESLPLPGHYMNYVGTVRRDTEHAAVSPYAAFPVFADTASNGISTTTVQTLLLVAPGMDPAVAPGSSRDAFDSNGTYIPLAFHGKIPDVRVTGLGSAVPFPNMIVSEHSGVYNPRSFATVNSIEVVNGRAYLMTVQRKYAPPVYN